MRKVAVRLVIGVLAGFASLTSAGAQGIAPLSLRIADEQVAPGGVLQMKLEVTEPKPISTGGGHLVLGEFDDLVGVAVHSLNGDAAAVAVRRPGGLTVRLASPSGSLGLQPDYPVLTTALRVPAGTPLGTQQPLSLEGGAEFLDGGGRPYPYEFKSGVATITQVPSITDVSPGSAALPAGAVVTIHGVGFDASVQVRFDETALASVAVVSPSLIRVVLGEPAVMHGMAIEIRGASSQTRTTYVSYQRTTPLPPSVHPLFAVVEPAFPAIPLTDASVRFQPAGATIVAGLALQNLGATVAFASLEMSDAAGSPLRQTSLTLPPNMRAVRTLRDLFGTDCGGQACVLRVRSAVPLQVLGILGDTTQSSATPLLAEPTSTGGGGPSLTTTTTAPNYRGGDVLALQATYVRGSTTVVADAYIVLQTPSGEMLSLTPGGLVSGLMPFAPGLTVTSMSQEVLRAVVPPGTPPGTYRWVSALTAPGTLSLLTPIASTSMTIAP